MNSRLGERSSEITHSGIRLRAPVNARRVRHRTIREATANDISLTLQTWLESVVQAMRVACVEPSANAPVAAGFGNRLTKYLIALDSLDTLVRMDDYQSAAEIGTKVCDEFSEDTIAAVGSSAIEFIDLGAYRSFVHAPTLVVAIRSVMDYLLALNLGKAPIAMHVHSKGEQVVFELVATKAGPTKRQSDRSFYRALLELAKLLVEQSGGRLVCFDSDEQVQIFVTVNAEYVLPMAAAGDQHTVLYSFA